MNAKFMEAALEQAELSLKEGEIPVGAVIVKDNKIIAAGRNMRQSKKSVFSHAECEAIAAAQSRLGDWRLDGCSMYVTLEPCMMCMGAIINARIDELCFAAFDSEQGAAESNFDFAKTKIKPPQIYGGIKEKAAKEILEKFFKDIR